MMQNDPTRRSALSVALLAHAGTDYEVDCWMAGDGQPNGSVRYDTDRAWFTIQGRPAALRELAEALLRCADLTEQTYPAPAAPVVEGWPADVGRQPRLPGVRQRLAHPLPLAGPGRRWRGRGAGRALL
jgi:hypothetical protein